MGGAPDLLFGGKLLLDLLQFQFKWATLFIGRSQFLVLCIVSNQTHMVIKHQAPRHYAMPHHVHCDHPTFCWSCFLKSSDSLWCLSIICSRSTLKLSLDASDDCSVYIGTDQQHHAKQALASFFFEPRTSVTFRCASSNSCILPRSCCCRDANSPSILILSSLCRSSAACSADV